MIALYMAADSQDKNIKNLINEIKRKVSLVCSNMRILEDITININAIFFKQFKFFLNDCIMTIVVIIDDYRHNNKPTQSIIQFRMGD